MYPSTSVRKYEHVSKGPSKPLAGARGSVLSHDRQGVVLLQYVLVFTKQYP
jgi:hypothetical protein